MPAKKEPTASGLSVPARVTRQLGKTAAIPNENDVQIANLQIKGTASNNVTTRRTTFANRPLLEQKSNVAPLLGKHNMTIGGPLKKSQALTLQPLQISKFGGGSTMITVDFATDIDEYLRHLEVKQRLPEDFLKSVPGVDGRMRQILVDWLIHVQRRFSLLSETLAVAVWILDRALMNVSAHKGNLQLIGVACLFIASKFEEITVPNIQDFVYVAADVFTKRDVLRMEQTVLQAVGFELSIPLAFQFLRRFRFYTMCPKNVHNLSKFICEVALVSYELAHHKQSTIAAVAIYLAAHILDFHIAPSVYKEAMLMKESELLEIARQFATPVLQMADPETKLYALRDKYAKETPVPFSKPALKRLETLAKQAPEAMDAH